MVGTRNGKVPNAFVSDAFLFFHPHSEKHDPRPTAGNPKLMYTMRRLSAVLQSLASRWEKEVSRARFVFSVATSPHRSFCVTLHAGNESQKLSLKPDHGWP